MLGVAQLGLRAVHLGARVEQLLRLEHVAAVVALVGAGAIEAADVAGALDVAVGQEAFGGGRVPLRAGLGVQEAVLLQRQEHGLRHLEVVLGVGGGEQVVRDAGLDEQIDELVVEALVDLFHRQSLGIGAQRDRRAVRVGARDDQHVVALQAVVAGDDIARQMRAGDVAHVDGGIGIGPGNGDEDVGGHGVLL